tara:strand:- start:5190 stop:6974 length:1785 start_codon:yes stop_codon:yes gene_type:complete
MATWRRYFNEIGTLSGQASPVGSVGSPNANAASNSKYNTWLPEVYAGQPNRNERYFQYDQMDSDTEINAAMDTIAEFSTQNDEKTGMPFHIQYKDKPTDTEVDVISEALEQWNSLNDWDKRCFKMFRNTVKQGDQVFVRDPETYKWLWVDMIKIDKILVNEGKGKKPESYFIRDLDLNIRAKNLTNASSDKYSSPMAYASGSMPFQGRSDYNRGMTSASMAPSTAGRFMKSAQTSAVDAAHVVHISLSEGMDRFWPFGTSILESIFKTYKQKELLEDSIIIYRVQRAPERRVFYIDVGNMPTNKAMGFIERIKNEIHQRRIPNRTGGGSNIMDAAYNPLSMMEDYFFAQTAEGRGSKVETLPGGQNLGDIDDLKYFNNKLLKGLRVPSAYLPSTPEDQSSGFSDGRVGTAYIQEFRFTKFCKRLQNMISPSFDKEFKMFLKHRGIEVDSGMFELKFNEPQNFGKYRQIELDSQLVNIFNQIQEIPYMSKRFAMKRFLKLDEEEIYENEKLWAEENKAQVGTTTAPGGGAGGGVGLGSVGASPMPQSPVPDDGTDPGTGGEESPLGGAQAGNTGAGSTGGDTGTGGTPPPVTPGT